MVCLSCCLRRDGLVIRVGWSLGACLCYLLYLCYLVYFGLGYLFGCLD